jgi:predicted transposase YdaD
MAFGESAEIDVIYPPRDIEQECLKVVQEFLDSGRITRIYLDELGQFEDLPWSLGLMALTILPSDEMVEKARGMLQKAEISSEESAILDLVVTAIVYKFAELTRDEVLTMLGLELKEPRAFREAREQGKAEAREEAILLVKLGEIDEELAAVVPKLMELDSREYNRLLLNLSRSPEAQAKLSELLTLP